MKGKYYEHVVTKLLRPEFFSVSELSFHHSTFHGNPSSSLSDTPPSEGRHLLTHLDWSYHPSPRNFRGNYPSQLRNSWSLRDIHRAGDRSGKQFKDKVCNECGKKFSSASGLHYHKKMHFGKRVKCPFCETWFSYQTGLRRHIKTVHHSQTTP